MLAVGPREPTGCRFHCQPRPASIPAGRLYQL